MAILGKNVGVDDAVDPDYASLHVVLMRAYDQAASGKGKDRHANADPFEDQVMCYLASQIGIAGPAFQVCKKTIEACRLPYPANVNELLGAINYAAGCVIEIERKAGTTLNVGDFSKDGLYMGGGRV